MSGEPPGTRRRSVLGRDSPRLIAGLTISAAVKIPKVRPLLDGAANILTWPLESYEPSGG
jgi:hypothetical protein